MRKLLARLWLWRNGGYCFRHDHAHQFEPDYGIGGMNCCRYCMDEQRADYKQRNDARNAQRAAMIARVRGKS
jgi:hypothetical protein